MFNDVLTLRRQARSINKIEVKIDNSVTHYVLCYDQNREKRFVEEGKVRQAEQMGLSLERV